MIRKITKDFVYIKENHKAVLKCNLCTGKQVAGFKDIYTGKFTEIMFVKSTKDIEDFMEVYVVEVISKEILR